MSPRGRTRPDRSLEKALLETYDYVGGLDEVGRGALAGPVSVGLAIVARRTDDDFPEGLADSKQLTARARTGLIEPVHGWLVDHAVAPASPAEHDEPGIVGALRMAGLRALQQVASGRAEAAHGDEERQDTGVDEERDQERRQPDPGPGQRLR